MFSDWKQHVLSRAEGVLYKQATPLPVKEVAWKAISFATKCGRSNPISYALRPVAANPRLRTSVGVYIAVLAIMTAFLHPLPSQAGNVGGVPTVIAAPEGEVTLTTHEGTRVPLKNFAISQRYWVLHPGLDMSSRLGEPVRPIMAGIVVKAEKSWFGYGNLVVVAHGAEYESWYAHLSKMNVTEGQEVNQETIVGEVGSTGRSTGPHLHLEVHENGVPVNPAEVLGIKNQATVVLTSN